MLSDCSTPQLCAGPDNQCLPIGAPALPVPWHTCSPLPRASTDMCQPGPCPPSLPTAFPWDREGGSCEGREAHVCWHEHLATTAPPGGKGSLLQDVIWGESDGFPGASENENDGLSGCDGLLTSATGSSIMKKGSMTFEEEPNRGDQYAELILTLCAEIAKLLGLLLCVGGADEAEPWWN